MKINYAKRIATVVLLSLSMNAAWAQETLVDLPGFDQPTQTSTDNSASTTNTTTATSDKKQEEKKPETQTPEKKPATPVKPAPPKPAPPKPPAPTATPSFQVGDVVTYKSRAATVMRINAEGQVLLKYDNGALETCEASQLSKGGPKTPSTNDIALYGTYEGRIVEIYANGMAKFVFNDGSSGVYSVSQMARVVSTLDGFQTNERVLLGSYEGTLKRLYSNGKVRFVYDDGSEGFYSLSSMVKILNSVGGWDTGQRAMYSGYAITIKRLYANGRALIQYDDGSANVISISSLVRIQNSLNGWSNNERAKYGNSEGTVRAIYSNATAQFQYDDGSTTTVSLGSLQHLVDSLNGYRKGEKVLYGSYDGELKSIYADGTALFKYQADGSQTVVSLSAFAHVVQRLDGWTVNDKVLYSGYEGRITALYSNGRARFRYDQDGSLTIVPTSSFLRMLTTLNGVHVGQRGLYGNSPGTIQQIYSNGTARFAYDGGSYSIISLSSFVRAL